MPKEIKKEPSQLPPGIKELHEHMEGFVGIFNEMIEEMKKVLEIEEKKRKGD